MGSRSTAKEANNQAHVDRPVQRRTGGRTAKVTAAALDAAVRLLLDEGYDAFGHRSVAAAAGIADTTVYRRWPTKAKLVRAAVEHLASHAIVVPDLGSFERDLTALATQVIASLARPEVGKMVRALIAAHTDEGDEDEARQAFWQGRFAAAAVIAERAMARQEIRADAVPVEVLETMAAPIYLRLLITGGPLDAALCERVVAHTLRAYQTPGDPGGRKRAPLR